MCWTCGLLFLLLKDLWGSFGLPWGLSGVLGRRVGGPLGVLGRPLGIIEGPWCSLGYVFGVPGAPGGSLGGPRDSQGVLWEVTKWTENIKDSLGVTGMGSWGALGGDDGSLGWSLGLTQGVHLLILRLLFKCFCKWGVSYFVSDSFDVFVLSKTVKTN